MENRGFEPLASRMQSGRSTTELIPPIMLDRAEIRTRIARFRVWSANRYTTQSLIVYLT